MKSTSAAHVSIHALSPADCADAAALSSFDRRSASVCAKAMSGAAATSSRDQTYLNAPKDLLIIGFSRLGFSEATPAHRPAQALLKVKAVTCTPVNNARATRHG